MVDIFKCHTSHPKFPTTALSLGHLSKAGKIPRPMHLWWQGASHQNHIGRQLPVYLHLYLPVVWGPKFGTNTKKTRRRGSRPRPRAVDNNYERRVPQALGETMLKLTANRETLVRKASEQAKFARTVDIGKFQYLRWFFGGRREHPEPRNSQNSS